MKPKQDIMEIQNELDQLSLDIKKIEKDTEIQMKQNFLAVGEKLSKARDICFKSKLKFNKWLESNTDISRQHAYRLMELQQKSITHPEMQLLTYSEALKSIGKLSPKETQYTKSYTEPVKPETVPIEKFEQLQQQLEQQKERTETVKEQSQEAIETAVDSSTGSTKAELFIDQLNDNAENLFCDNCAHILRGAVDKYNC